MPLPSRKAPPVGLRKALLLGDPDWANVLIGALHRDPGGEISVVGIMTHDGRDAKLRLRGVPMLGSPDVLEDILDKLDQEGRCPDCVIVNQKDQMLLGPNMEIGRAQRLKSSH